MRPPIGMDVRRFLAFAFALALGACQNAANTPIPDAGPPPPDAAIGVACSGSICGTDVGCCAATGGAPFCMSATVTTCSGRLLKCDGPEDCTNGDVCCNLTSGDTACQSATACQGDGTISCNTDGDCPAGVASCCNHVCSASACNFW